MSQHNNMETILFGHLQNFKTRFFGGGIFFFNDRRKKIGRGNYSQQAIITQVICITFSSHKKTRVLVIGISLSEGNG